MSQMFPEVLIYEYNESSATRYITSGRAAFAAKSSAQIQGGFEAPYLAAGCPLACVALTQDCILTYDLAEAPVRLSQLRPKMQISASSAWL